MSRSHRGEIKRSLEFCCEMGHFLGAGSALKHCVQAHTWPHSRNTQERSRLRHTVQPHAPLLLALSVVEVPLPQDEEERGARRGAEDDRQDPPQSDAVALLLEERLVVQPREEVAEALFGRLELDEVVVQDQLAHAGDAVSQPQHLLRLVDALGSLPADEVADDVGKRLDGGVEVLVRGLQVQLGGVERAYDPNRGGDAVIVRAERKGNGVVNKRLPGGEREPTVDRLLKKLLQAHTSGLRHTVEVEGGGGGVQLVVTQNFTTLQRPPGPQTTTETTRTPDHYRDHQDPRPLQRPALVLLAL
ncbi:hypothetical protein EYF80_005429 [Liparis tanakae]|uniref:Uncharacterized protein n=1 Tax=Liparis tanakae TaxID=230148 RepID=A0A4Z2J2M9_9TELE|nr:hypothetical protein EYF80_005429 [Liparis tanakae]